MPGRNTLPIGRRSLLAAGGLFAGSILLGRAGPARGRPSPRVAGLGWASAQTLLALGVVPVAVPEIARYGRLVVEPAIPDGVQEAGLRPEPNLELLQELGPDLIVIDSELEPARRQLERIAPVETFLIFTPAGRPGERALAATRSLAARLGMVAEGKAYLAAAEAEMAQAQAAVALYRGGPVYVISEVFANRALVFGQRSLYQGVLDRFGLTNAWTGGTTLWGHSTVPLDALSAPDARLLFLGSQLRHVEAVLAARPMWRMLPFFRSGRVTALSEILFYGGIPSMTRFARLLAEKLPKGEV